MRIQHWIAALVSLLVTSISSAQSFEQLAGLRDVAPASSVRSAAMGGTLDRTATDIATVADDPSNVARINKLSLSIAGSNHSFSTVALRPTSDGSFSYEQRTTAAALSQLAVAAPSGRVVVSGYFVDEPRMRSSLPVITPVAAEGEYVVPCAPDCSFAYSVETAFDRRSRQFGAIAAWTSGPLDVGVGAELRDLDARSGTARLILPNTTDDGNRSDRLVRRVSGTAVVPTAAITWHVVPRVAVGASYKGGGTFDRTTSACRTDSVGVPQCRSALTVMNTARQKMPATMRADVAVTAAPGLQLAAAVVHRDYDVLSDDPYTIAGTAGSLPYRAANETHAGAEYRFARVPVTLRAGWWRDPARIGGAFTQSNPWAESVDHHTLGAAVSVSGSELALAVDDGGDRAGRRASLGITHTF